MGTDARLHRALGDPSRVRILDLLRDSAAPLDASELAGRVGLHANTVRSHLRMLAGAGLVSVQPEERHTRGRPRLVYQAVTDESSGGSVGGYRLLAEILASELAGSGEESVDRAIRAGQTWGRFLVDRRPPNVPASTSADLEAVLQLLDEVGFDPSLEEDDVGHTVLMQRCPFGEVADHYRKIVCAVHLGLMQGALEELGAHARADLVPFERPGVCVSHVATVSAGSGAARAIRPVGTGP
jgi:predicted ArsR family transcriptional regulator